MAQRFLDKYLIDIDLKVNIVLLNVFIIYLLFIKDFMLKTIDDKEWLHFKKGKFKLNNL
jgi:hypothetical protein